LTKIALYCRVSTEDQTCENQKLRLVDFAKRQEWNYELFEEVESSRKTRPIKTALMNKLRIKEFDGVCVWKLDRWGRSSQELVLEIEEMYEKRY